MAPSELTALYAESRDRLIDLAAELDDPATAVAVPCCPEWTVRDVYAHVAGVQGDILAGRLDGVATEAWTSRQVTERAGDSLAEICAAWADGAGALAALTDAGGPPELVIDVWTHEQDIRGALGRPGGRDTAQVPFCLAAMVPGLLAGWAERDGPPIAVEGTTRRWLSASDPVAATLTGPDFELLRALTGRRSEAQLRAMWRGDGGSKVTSLHAFDLAARDIVE